MLAKITLKIDETPTDPYVLTNMSGDVEEIYSSSGTLEARYVYDTWGKTVQY